MHLADLFPGIGRVDDPRCALCRCPLSHHTAVDTLNQTTTSLSFTVRCPVPVTIEMPTQKRTIRSLE